MILEYVSFWWQPSFFFFLMEFARQIFLRVSHCFPIILRPQNASDSLKSTYYNWLDFLTPCMCIEGILHTQQFKLLTSIILWFFWIWSLYLPFFLSWILITILAINRLKIAIGELLILFNFFCSDGKISDVFENDRPLSYQSYSDAEGSYDAEICILKSKYFWKPVRS